MSELYEPMEMYTYVRQYNITYHGNKIYKLIKEKQKNKKRSNDAQLFRSHVRVLFTTRQTNRKITLQWQNDM